MCDENTLADAARAASRSGLSRRDFGVTGTAAALAAYGGEALAAGFPLAQSTVMVPMGDGAGDAFFVHPARGRHPAIILWPDIAGLRDANQAMARRLAAAGYAVLAVNQYWRSARAPVLHSFAEWRQPGGQERLAPMIARITPDSVVRDGVAYVAWLDRQAAVDTKRGIGSCGYCMGGPFAVRTAWAAPRRVRAVASLHGGGLVGDKPDSPHRLLEKTAASYLFAIARNDDARAPADKDTLRAAAAAAHRPAEIEVYRGDHGWTVPDSPSYDKAEADRAFARMLALFARL